MAKVKGLGDKRDFTLPQKPIQKVAKATDIKLPTVPNLKTKAVTAPITATPVVKPTAVVPPVNQQVEPVVSAPPLALPQVPKKIIEPIQQAPTEADVQKQIQDRLKNQARTAFQNQFKLTEGRLEAERQAIDPQFNRALGEVDTRDTMAKTRAGKLAAVGGEQSGGALAQTEISQNIATAQSVSELIQQRVGLEADIERRLSEAQIARDQGIATADSEAAITELQSSLATIRAKTAADIRSAEIKNEQDFTLTRDNMSKLNDIELLQLKNDLTQENTILDGQIQRARDNNQAGIAQQLEAVRAQNDLKLQAARNAGDINLQNLRGSQELQQIGARGQEELTQIAARSEEDTIDQPTFDDTAVNSALGQAIQTSKANFDTDVQQGLLGIGNVIKPGEEPVYSPTDERDTVKQFLVENIDDLSIKQGEEIMFQYKITPEELNQMLQTGLSPGGQ